jgi:hypothetical protein
VAATIVKLAQQHGYKGSDLPAILATAYGESSLNPSSDGGIQTAQGSPGGEADRVLGIFQQKASWGSVQQRQDPAYAANAFLTALDQHPNGDIWSRITATQVGPPASYYQQYLSQAQSYLKQLGVTYDAGGWLKQGLTLTNNQSGHPEPILTHEQGVAVQSLAKSAVATDRQRAQGGYSPQPIGVAPPPASSDHVNPAVAAGIQGAANAASTAASVASFGIPGAGSLASGAVKTAGSVIQGALNVGSSFLVGTLDRPYEGSPYGMTYRPQQNAPVTAPHRGGGVHIGQMTVADPFEMRRQLDIHDSQQQQSFGANHSYW